MSPIRNIALMAIATIGLSIPAANAQYNGYSFNGNYFNGTQPFQQRHIWNNPNGGLTRREAALLQKLNRQIAALETRLRIRSLSFRERAKLTNKLRELRRQIAQVRHDNRLY